MFLKKNKDKELSSDDIAIRISYSEVGFLTFQIQTRLKFFALNMTQFLNF